MATSVCSDQMDQRMPRSISPVGGGHGRPFGSPDFDVADLTLSDHDVTELENSV
jgi:hypothetical protein